MSRGRSLTHYLSMVPAWVYISVIAALLLVVPYTTQAKLTPAQKEALRRVTIGENHRFLTSAEINIIDGLPDFSASAFERILFSDNPLITAKLFARVHDLRLPTLRDTAPDLPTDERTRTLLAHEKEIRIVVGGGGGMGNQRAALTIMARLRQMGFKGAFLIAADARHLDTEKRILELVESHAASFPQIAEGGIKVEAFSRANPPKSRVRFAFAASDDAAQYRSAARYSYDADSVNAKTFFSLRPTDWTMGGDPYVEHNNKIVPLPPGLVLADRLSYKGREKELIESSALEAPAKAYLSSLMHAVKQGKVDLQVVYGLHPWKDHGLSQGVPTPGINADEELQRLHGGYESIKGELKRPVVVLVLSQVTNQQFPASVPHPPLIEQSSHLDGMKAGEVRFVNLGGALTRSIPQPVFDMLMLESTIPPLLEGANARTLTKAGRSKGLFLPGGRKAIRDDPAQTSAVSKHPKEARIFDAAEEALTHSVAPQDARPLEKAVGQFLKESLLGKMDRFFETWHQAYLDRRDMLASAFEVFHAMESGVLERGTLQSPPLPATFAGTTQNPADFTATQRQSREALAPEPQSRTGSGAPGTRGWRPLKYFPALESMLRGIKRTGKTRSNSVR